MTTFKSIRKKLTGDYWALGMLTVPALATALEVTDIMLKHSDSISLIGILTRPHHISVVIAGEPGYVRSALAAASQTLGGERVEISQVFVVRPHEQLLDWLEAVLGGHIPGFGTL